MKVAQILAVVGLAITASMAQAPSPTESLGCVAHGDHWHCEGSRATQTTGAPAVTTASTTPVTSTTSTASHDHDDDHDHDHSSTSNGSHSLPPSPTASVGCTPHGDHWHCDGPVSTTTTTSAPTGTGAASNGTATTSRPVSVGAAVAGARGAGLGVAAGAVVGAALLVL